jgi:hypothetical protein
LVEIVRQLAAPVGAAQRRGANGHAHDHVQRKYDKGNQNDRGKHDAKHFTHDFILNEIVVKWNPDSTVQEPQIPRVRSRNYVEYSKAHTGVRRARGADSITWMRTHPQAGTELVLPLRLLSK